MSYFVEILEWFSKHSKRNLRIFEATILEAEDPNKENTGPPVFNYSAQGKLPNQKSYKLPFTKEGLQSYNSAELQNYLLANPDIVTKVVPGPNIHKPQKVDLGNNKTLWVWKSEGDGSGDTPQEKPEEQEAAIDPTIQQPVSLFVTEANRVVDDLGKAHNSDGGLLARAKRLIKKVMEERKNKDLTNTDESYIRLMSDGIGKFIERFLGDGQHSLRRKILDASVQRTRLADGTYVEASDEERARMVSQVFDHLSKLLSSDKMTASDRQKYKDSVKIVKSPTTNGRYRILIYSEDKSLAISLPYAGISRAVFEGLAIEKFKDSKQELKALDVETYSNAYSGVFGNILEQLTVARVQLNNARADLEKCKDENYRKILAQRCANLGEKIKQLDNEFSERVKTLVVNVRELSNLAVDQQAALGSAEYIEGISQAIAELTPILGDQYKDQLKQLEKLTEKEKKEETKNLFVKLCNKVAGMVMFYSADFNKALANADHAVGVGGKVKGGGRRQDIRYFYADENKAKEAADFLGMKLQEIDISDVEELKRLIPEDRGGFDLDYLINKAKSNGETKIYMLEDSVKNSLDSDGNTKLATIKSQHHTIETNFMITALEKGFDSPEAKLAMEEYNKFVTEKLNAVPLTRKEFEDRLGSLRSRLGKLFTPEGTTANEADINKRIVKALKEANRRSARLVEIGNDTAEKITRTIGGKEVTGQKLTMVAGMLKKACSELGIPTDEETFSRLTSEDDTDVEYGRLRDILKDIDNPSKYEENPEYATQCVQKALNFLMNEASARKIRSGNIEEAEVLAATMFSKLGVSIDDLPISHTNYGSRTVGVASHNGILEHFAQAIIGMARTKGANKDHKIFVTADGIRISTEKEASRSDPDAPTQDASLTITTKFTGSSKSGGETVGVVNKAGMIALSHRRTVYDVQGSDTNRSKIRK